MFRTILPRRISPAPRPSLSLLSLRLSRNSSKHSLKTVSLQPHTRPGSVQLYYPPCEQAPKSLFSTTSPRLINEAEGTFKFGGERKNVLEKRLESNPKEVTTTSSMTPILDPTTKAVAYGGPGNDPDMLRGLRSDLRIVRETFQLNEVPKEVLYIGIGGLVPYLGTSLSTLYLAWDINFSQENGIGYLISGETAENLLHILEPLQVGLGAIILSFLGAIHWGLEMAEYGGKHKYKRYSLSILAPVLAWPTLLLPVNMALIAQFVGFTGMYFADSTATSKGWAPRWYMTYRFLLTFIVEASIVTTLVGRGQIGDRVSKLPGPADYLQDLRDSQWENLRKEENERKRKLIKEETKAMESEKEQYTTAKSKYSKDQEAHEGNSKKGAGEQDKGTKGLQKPKSKAKENTP